jgi:hypothetical protein
MKSVPQLEFETMGTMKNPLPMLMNRKTDHMHLIACFLISSSIIIITTIFILH